MSKPTLDSLRYAETITSRSHHDVGIDTRHESAASNLVPSLGMDGECPGWLIISTMTTYQHGGSHRGRPKGAKNHLTPARDSV